MARHWKIYHGGPTPRHRQFMRVSIAAGAVVATALVPLSIVHAVPAQGAVALTPMANDPSWNGHVDDACGHWRPRSRGRREPRGHADEVFAANVHPADYFLIA